MMKSRCCLNNCNKILIKDLIENSLDNGKIIFKKEYIDMIPKLPGVYFLISNNIIIFDNKSNNTKIHYTKSNIKHYEAKCMLLNKANILYIGSSKDLRKRISQYLNTMFNNSTSHKGGKGVVYLKRSILNKSYFSYYTCPYECYEFLEKQELLKFVSKHGCLPLFNKEL